MESILVAVVDDETQVRVALGRLLRLEGYQVAPFDSGDAFLSSRGQRVPACVLLDVNMPGLSLEERYGSHAGYVAAVARAAANAVARGFLLQPDADALVAAAEASQVLK
jgi:CheY-like chemotaxis protein